MKPSYYDPSFHSMGQLKKNNDSISQNLNQNNASEGTW